MVSLQLCPLAPWKLSSVLRSVLERVESTLMVPSTEPTPLAGESVSQGSEVLATQSCEAAMAICSVPP